MVNYTLHFACSPPGEPGCGCPDGNFHGEHKFEGSPAEAIKEAKRLQLGQYMGDFTYWITGAPCEPSEKQWRALFKDVSALNCNSTPELAPLFKEQIYHGVEDSHGVWNVVQYTAYNSLHLVEKGTVSSYHSREGKHIGYNGRTLETLIYDSCLLQGKEVTHVVRKQGFGENLVTVKQADIYPFQLDAAVLLRYHQEQLQDEVGKMARFYDECRMLRQKGTTV